MFATSHGKENDQVFERVYAGGMNHVRQRAQTLPFQDGKNAIFRMPSY